MNNDQVTLPPCPECGGARAWFQFDEKHALTAGFGKYARFYACVCLGCGTTTLRPAPHRMEEIREWARTQKPFAF